MRLIDAEKAVEELSVAYWDKGIQAAKDDPCVIDAMTDWAIRTIKAMPTMSDWIPYPEQAPKEEKEYLISCKEGWVETRWYNPKEWSFFNVNAWMPLPEPYKG